MRRHNKRQTVKLKICRERERRPLWGVTCKLLPLRPRLAKTKRAKQLWINHKSILSNKRRNNLVVLSLTCRKFKERFRHPISLCGLRSLTWFDTFRKYIKSTSHRAWLIISWPKIPSEVVIIIIKEMAFAV